MNIIGFDVIIEQEKESLINNRETWNIGIEVIIDNHKIHNFKEFPINILDLINSKKNNGDFYIFTCSCGIPECMNIYPVAIKHKENHVLWNFEKGSFKFEKHDYQKKIDLVVEDFLDNYQYLEKEGFGISLYPATFLELNMDEDIISKIKSLKEIEQDENIKYDLCKFVYDEYLLDDFTCWLEKNEKLNNIIEDLFNKTKNRNFESIKELKKYLKDNLDKSVLNELRDLKKKI